MNIFIKITSFVSFLLLPIKLHSQTVIGFGKTSSGAALTNSTLTIGGISTNNAKYSVIIEGSPFFNDTFTMGRIILSNGQIFDSISLRLDLIDNTVHYINSQGEEMSVYTGIRSIIFYDSVLEKKNHFDHSDFIAPITDKGWYELLDTGTVKLYKCHSKFIKENKAYNSATVEQAVTTSFGYYILSNAVFTQVKKIKSLPEMLQNKKTELLEYIYNNTLTGKTDKDYIALIGYYNSLVKK